MALGWTKRVTSFIAKRAKKKGALGTGLALFAGNKARKRMKTADDFQDIKGTRRGDCLAAQVRNGHRPDDMTDSERAFLYPDD